MCNNNRYNSLGLKKVFVCLKGKKEKLWPILSPWLKLEIELVLKIESRGRNKNKNILTDAKIYINIDFPPQLY